jgi:hypothetical protein
MKRIPWLLVLVIAACGGDKEPASPETKPAAKSPDLLLTSDPGDALTVAEARDAAPREGVAVIGRVATIVDGLAAFQLVDESLEYCGQVNKEDKCGTPWDYCCYQAEERAAHTAVVEVRGADGEVLDMDALPGLRLLDLVVVKGDLIKDEQGNVTVVATGWYRRTRPELADWVELPE